MKKTLVAWAKKGIRMSYFPSKNPKKGPLPGPFTDLTVVGLFVILALGYFAF